MTQAVEVGTKFARYRIEALIGRGGAGQVYLAEQIRLKRKVALKVLAPDVAQDPASRQRFVRESQIVASLDHANIVPIYEADEVDGLLFIAMRYVEGEDLKTLIAEENRLDLPLAHAIISQVADALDAAHARGLVHRDVKPSNILIQRTERRDDDPHVFLADFGLSKSTASQGTITAAGQFVGSVAYTAPEQIMSEPLDGRADVYSLGCVLFHCLTGQYPFPKATDPAMMWAHLQEPPPQVSVHRPDLPPEMDAVVERALAKSPEDRFQTCGELASALGALLKRAGAGGTEVLAQATQSFDVYLAYNRTDEAIVHHLTDLLSRAGLKPCAATFPVPSGVDRRTDLRGKLQNSRACAVLVGESGAGDWEREEMVLAREQAASRQDFSLVPVLLPGLPEPFDPTMLPPFLAARRWVDLRPGIDEAALQVLAREVGGAPISREAVTLDDSPPYRGLQTFDEEHARFFFGREADIQRLVERLKASRFLTILGPSGSGKSSLARAGLVPAIRAGALPGSDRWEIALLRPGPEPLEVLSAELFRWNATGSAKVLSRQMAEDHRTLHRAASVVLTGRPPTDQIVLLIDQFEEVFTLCRDERERKSFLSNLLYAASAPGGRSVVVLTMRADFYPRCAAYPDLAQLAASEQFLVGPMSEDGVRRAIEQPARLVGLSFDRGLVDTILRDVGSQPATLPLLEHALFELWVQRRGGRLTLQAYRQVGGVEGAIARRAEAIYKELDTNRQAIVRSVMLRLTQPGEGTEDTRRRAMVDELATVPDQALAVEAVVEELVRARLLTLSAAERGGERWVDVSHEALIRAWPRLRGWIEEDRAGLRLHRRLTEAAHEWDAMGRDESLVYRGARLAEALEWRSRDGHRLNELERAFLDAGEQLADREQREAEERRQKELEAARRIAAARRFRVVAGILAVAVVASGIATVIALRARTAANTARQQSEAAATTADRARQQSEEAALKARAFLALQTDPRTAAVLAAVAARAKPGIDARGVLPATRSLVRSFGIGQQIESLPSAALNRDGTRIMAIGPDGSFALWDVNSGKRLAYLPGGKDRTLTGTFDPAGSHVATGGTDGRVRVWDAAKGRLLKSIQTGSSVQTLAFSAEGAQLIAGGPTNPGSVIDWVRGTKTLNRLVKVILHQQQPPFGVAFGPSGLILELDATTGGAIYGIQSDGIVGSFPVTNEPPVYSASFSPGGRLLAVADSGGVRLLRTSVVLLEEASTVTEGGPVVGLGWSPDGSLLVTAGLDGTAVVYDVESRAVLQNIHIGTPVLDAVFSPDAGRVVVAGADGTARIFDVSSGKQLSTVRDPDGELLLYAGLFNFHGESRIVTQDAAGTVRVWDMASHGLVRTLRPSAP
jgi:serine/threonine protein kinase/WD40 repeat protein